MLSSFHDEFTESITGPDEVLRTCKIVRVEKVVLDFPLAPHQEVLPSRIREIVPTLFYETVIMIIPINKKVVVGVGWMKGRRNACDRERCAQGFDAEPTAKQSPQHGRINRIIAGSLNEQHVPSVEPYCIGAYPGSDANHSGVASSLVSMMRHSGATLAITSCE